MRHRIALAILTIVVLVVSAFAGAARTQTEPLTIYAAASLTDVFRSFDPSAALQLRRLERARNADPERRARGHLRVRGAAQHAAPLRAGTRRQARHVHLEPARADRPEVEPGRPPFRIRPEAEAGQARRRRRGGAGRRLHANGAAQDGAHLRPLQGREPGDRRARRHRQGRTRAGGRGLRVRDGRARRERPGHGDPDPGLGAAARALRDRRRVEVDEEGGCSGMDQDTALGRRVRQR